MRLPHRFLPDCHSGSDVRIELVTSVVEAHLPLAWIRPARARPRRRCRTVEGAGRVVWGPSGFVGIAWGGKDPHVVQYGQRGWYIRHVAVAAGLERDVLVPPERVASSSWTNRSVAGIARASVCLLLLSPPRVMSGWFADADAGARESPSRHRAPITVYCAAASTCSTGSDVDGVLPACDPRSRSLPSAGEDLDVGEVDVPCCALSTVDCP